MVRKGAAASQSIVIQVRRFAVAHLSTKTSVMNLTIQISRAAKT